MLNASVSPHIRHGLTTATVMRDVAIAMMPALLFGVFVFGLRALIIIVLSAVTAVLTEYVYQRLMKLPVTANDGSALVTGLILAMNMPASVPFWVPVLGSVFAILVVKQLFGGLGQNIANPAVAARCFLIISFPALVGSMPAVGNLVGEGAFQAFGQRMTTLTMDAVSTATPLALVKEGKFIDLWQAFLGLHSGCIGETSTLAILIGLVYMLARRVVHIRIPAIYVVSAVGFAVLFGLLKGDVPALTLNFLVGQACTGGLMAGAVFMATDYVTSPITKWGQVVYALLLGLLTAIFRTFGGTAEGVSYAILIGNMVVPLIEKATMPRTFGKNFDKKGGAAA